MAREFGAVNISIWQDADFRALPVLAQHLYLTLWTHPDLSYCGVVDYRPGRIAKFAAWLNTDIVEAVAACLEANHFLVIDRESEEALIRSWIRWDGLMKQPRLAVSMTKAYAATASNQLRGVVVNELHKIQSEAPELACWGNEKVRDVLSQPRINVKDGGVPSDPFGEGFGQWFTQGFTQRLGQTPPKHLPSVSVAPTPSPTPSPLLPANQGASDDAPSRFNEFWTAYPSRGQHSNPKKPARTKFDRIAKTIDPQVLIDAATDYARARRGQDPQHTAQAQTWLNQERWNDEPGNVHHLPDPAIAREASRLGVPKNWMN